MSLLDNNRKPVVDFDPRNPEHIQVLMNFLAGKSLKDVPYTFSVKFPDYTNWVNQALKMSAMAWGEHVLAQAQQPQPNAVVQLQRHR